jgi:hypothetical protein
MIAVRTDRHDRPLTAVELLMVFGPVRGPDLRDPRSTHRPRRLARWGHPTHERERAARRGTVPSLPTIRTDAVPHDTVGLTTVWAANAPSRPRPAHHT